MVKFANMSNLRRHYREKHSQINLNEVKENDNVASSTRPQEFVQVPGLDAKPKRPRGRPRSKRKVAIAAYMPQRASD